MSGNPQKLKLLYLMRLLGEETDAEHGVTMNRILEYLAERGIVAERKSIYRDIRTLREFGFEVEVAHRLPDEYSMGQRMFTLEELTLLVDSVQSSRFMTKRSSDKLVKRLKSLASARQRKALDKQVHVQQRIRSQSESVLANVDLIQQAISQRRKILFRYYSYDSCKRKVPRREGAFYEESPLHVVYADGNYYMVSYNEEHDSFPHYRIDRMDDVVLSDEKRVRNLRIANYDVGELEKQGFGMYSGEKVSVTMVVDESVMDVVVDRFGKDVLSEPLPNGRARVHVNVMNSPVFFGWLSTLGNKVTIEIPSRLAREYCAYLKSIIECYENDDAEADAESEQES